MYLAEKIYPYIFLREKYLVFIHLCLQDNGTHRYNIKTNFTLEKV
jgi:hypothetical protein